MKLKEQPEDFRVKELKEMEKKDTGKYLYFLLKKKNRTTPGAIEEIANTLNISQKDIGYAGNKDKIAVTEQYVSFFGVRKEQVENLDLKDIELQYITHAEERITLGALEGNQFEIVVRDLEKEKKLEIKKIKNYFDEQRFGKEGTNHLIGKALVKQDFEKACALSHLKAEKNNYIGALRAIDKKTLRFYLHSYQSYLWNKAVEKVKEEKKIALIGYLTTFEGEEKKTYEQLLKEEGVTLKDFLMKAMPELNSEGTEREVFTPVKDFKFTWEKDEIHEGKYKVILTFFLKPGVYATQVVKQLFGKPL